ncbi:MAG: hydrogenase maturation nickel metallochaperone HypA [Hyphomicrobiaceae bacterium]|nr:hydrogenase maturation nickel metallochaperone HypA [Hyphomicrobiaceae bacterium]
MHEMSLCEGIREVIETQVAAHSITKINTVRLEIGCFASVDKHALAFAFDVVMHGSIADGAKLEIIDIPGRAMCFNCAKEVELDDRLNPCPLCGSGRLVPTGGGEIRVKDLEVV